MPMSPRLLRPRASGFNPKTISTLAGWWDASVVSSFAQNSNGTTAATSNGDPIGYWQDLSGNGKHMTQATSNLRPSLLTSGINGRPSVSVPNTSNAGFSSISAPTTSTTGCVFVVARFTSGAFWISFARNDNAGFFDAAADTAISPTLSAGTPTYRVNRAGLAAPVTRLSLYNGMGINTRYLLCVQNINFSTWTSAWRAFDYGSSFQFVGNVAECLVLSSITSAQVTAVENYLKSKWGTP